MTKKIQTCSNCNEEGHNKRTCPELKDAVVEEKKKVKKKQKRKSKKITSDFIPKTHDGRDLSIVPTPIGEKQLLHILQKTPRHHVYTRKAKGGGEWEYVTGHYVKKVLNYVFGWMWDFEVVDKGKEGGQVWVQGRLIIKNPDTGAVQIKKEQFGGADIKYKTKYVKKGNKKVKVKTDEMLDYRNDLKAAATDALKKCASELGIASDIYAGNEFKDISAGDSSYTPPEEIEIYDSVDIEDGKNKSQPTKKAENLIHECHECAKLINKTVNDYSKRVHGKPLCRDCQNKK